MARPVVKKHYDLQAMSKSYKIDLRGSGNIKTAAGMDSFIKKFYEKNKVQLEERNKAQSESTGKPYLIKNKKTGKLVSTTYSRFRNLVREYVEEGYDFNSALRKTINSSWWTDQRDVMKNNFKQSLKKNPQLMNQLRKTFGWQSGYEFLNKMEYDAKATADLGVPVAYSYMGVTIALDNSPTDGVAGYKVIY